MNDCFTGLLVGFWLGWTLCYFTSQLWRKELNKIWNDIFKEKEEEH